MKIFNDAEIRKMVPALIEIGGNNFGFCKAFQSSLQNINPPTESDGWILIDTEEKRQVHGPIQRGDEYRGRQETTWICSARIGEPMSPHSIYRRKVTTGAAWRPVSEGVTYPCIGRNFDDETVPPILALADIGNWRHYHGITHFISVTLPPPPASELSAVEKAYLTHKNNPENLPVDYASFKVGWEAAKGAS